MQFINSTCTSQVAPCEICLATLPRITHPPPCDRSKYPFARHASLLHQQPALHFTQPTSTEHPTGTNAPPPSDTPIKRSTACPINRAFTCPPPIDRPGRPRSINYTKRHIQAALPPINDPTPRTSDPPCTTLPRSVSKDATSALLPSLILSWRSHLPPQTPLVEQSADQC